MRTVVLTVFILLSAKIWAASPVPDILREVQEHKPGAFKRAEAFYRSSKSDAESARLATILAFAPEGETVTPAYVYAAFSFEKDRTLPESLRLKMAKLSGEGFFNHAQFARAKDIFLKALALPGLDESSREYLSYQLAWCEINQRDTKAAIARLSSWLKTCEQCSLRKEMSMDLGKAWAERTGPLPDLDPGDYKPFVEGFAAGLEREGHFNLGKTSARLRSLPIYPAWIAGVLDGSTFKSLDACQRLTVTTAKDSGTWPKEIAAPAIKRCAEKILKENLATVPSSYVLELYEALPEKTAQDYFMLGDLALHSKQPSKACNHRLEAMNFPEVVDADTYVRALLPVCKGNAQVPHLLENIKMIERWNSLETVKRDTLLAYYLSSIADSAAWRKDFTALPAKSWVETLHPSNAIFENLVRDPKWPLDFRLGMWALSPEAVAFDPQVLSDLTQALAHAGKSEKYLEFVHTAQKRSGRNDAFLSLLAARKDPAERIPYGPASAEDNWNRLNESERMETLERLLKQGSVDEILSDWKIWSKRVSIQSALLRPIADEIAESGNRGVSGGDDVPTQIVRAILAWKNSTEVFELKPEVAAWPDRSLAGDLTFIQKMQGAAVELEKIELNAAAGEEQVAQSIERGLAVAEKSLRELRRHKWSGAKLAKLNRGILKRGLAKFRQQVESIPEYGQIAKMVLQWESKL